MSSATRTPGVPSPSTTSKAKAQVWPEADVSVVAFRFHALGSTERATELLLSHLASTGVRNIRGYVNGIGDDDLMTYLRKADKAAAVARRAGLALGAGRRGDLLIPRRPRRWPWATTSSGGGGV